MTAIITRDLKKYYGSVHALDGLSLEVQEGHIFGFLGPNGAGKTTTIRLLTGLTRASGGEAHVADVNIVHANKVASLIGYLPEEPAFYKWMTASEFLDYIGRIFKLPGEIRRKRVKDLLEHVGLSQVARRRIGGFSRGMRQRLGLAQALINQPSVLFLDEPVSALDPAGRKEVLEMIAGLRGKCTVFMSTHILEDVERVCDSIGIIDQGKLIVNATQAELMARYTIPAFEVELETGHEKILAAWLKTLDKEKWITAIRAEGLKSRITVKEVDKARLQLLASINGSQLTVKRFEVVTPTLEDIFLQVVNGKGGAK